MPQSSLLHSIPWTAAWARCTAVLLVALLLSGVAGTPSTFAQARVQIIHNSPDPGASTVDIYVDNGTDPFVDDLNFRDATGYVDVPAGTREIDIAPGNSTGPGDAIYTQNLSVQDGETYVVIASGVLNPSQFEANPDGVNREFELVVKSGARESATQAGEVQFFAAHGAPDAPTVDVRTNDGSATLVDDLPFKSTSGYVGVSPGVYTLDVTSADQSSTVATYEADLSGLGGGTATVLASGFLTPGNDQNGPGFQLIAALADGTVVTFTPVARAQIIHNAPDPNASTVDIYVDNGANPFVNDLSFRGATGFVNVPAGTREIDIAPGGSSGPGDAVATQNVTFETGSTYSVIASGELGNDFQLLAKADARELPASTDGDVEFFGVHGAPDAPQVDVQTNDGSTTLLGGISYSGIQPASGNGYNAAPTGTYTLDVNVSSSGNTAATFEADLSGFGDQAVTLLASGYLTPGDEGFSTTPEGFGLIAVDASGNVVSFTPVARAQIIHNSPDPAASTVDIYVDNGSDPFVDDLDFREATGFVNVPAGTREIDIAPGNSTGPGDQVATQNVTFETGKTYSIVASGVLGSSFEANPGGANTDFQLLQSSGAREMAATTDGKVEVRVGHGATDAPAVDILANGGTPPLVDNASYSAITGYLDAPAGQVTLDVTPDDDNSTVLYSFDADLTSFADTPLTVLASGFNTPDNEGTSPVAPFTLIAVAPNGDVIDLGAARAQIIHNSGDPDARVVDIYVDGQRILDDFAYRSASPFVDLDSGVRDIAVAPSTSTSAEDAITTFTEEVPTNGALTIIANGVLAPADFQDNPGNASTAFDLDIATGARESVSTTDGDVEIRAAHGATDAPTVDVLANGSSTPPFVDNASYPAITDYRSAAATQVTLDVTPDDDNSTSLYTYEVDLSPFADTPLTVLASGFNTTGDESTGQIAPFTLLGIAPDGTVINLGSDVVINEFLADPNGSVDANGDETAGTGDQFVELVNVSTTETIDLAGYTISTNSGSYTLPDVSGTTLSPGTGLVVFNGGSPTGFGVFAGTGLPAINSGGDEIVLSNAGGATLETVQFGGGSASSSAKSTLETGVPVQAGESTAREVNGSGGFVLHTNLSDNSVTHSAGQNNESGAVLPVEMADFSATLDGSDAVLTWRTLSEQNNSGFTVQHRVGDGAFEEVGFRDGQGTTEEATSYRFRVADLAPGAHAFRLKQVDLDGSSSLTDVVRVEVQLDEAYSWSKVAPNPVQSSGTLSLRVRKTQEVTVALYDVLGRQVRTLHDGIVQTESRQQLTLDGSDLSPGTYLLRAEGEQFSDTQQITVVK
jgi:hypothetical protein